ncbi:DNA cytosine methyltransferase [Actinokineospora enzanensis]|uniref:DNA cytosine methyltransferase n=1 Tax=Actinokineospora enzanensis TaxID=155975 RepID=UPI00037CA617|nr:DNA cytosine methyltransferase [Actinokineospora enzanensis]
MIVDLFAGPGGWDTGARLAGYSGPLVGIDHDPAACATATAAGHPRLRADIARLDPDMFAGLATGLIGSPPCPGFSSAGTGAGLDDIALVAERIAAHARGDEPPDVDWADPRSPLTAEPMRWAVALRPRWIALEQVPAVLPLWRYAAELLRADGYATWTGVLSAEEYGVPQTRKRAILIARRDGHPAGPPPPTHQAYRPDQAYDHARSLFGDSLPPPVSMAEALGGALGGVALRHSPQGHATERATDEPAGTILCSRPGNLQWITSRPATTVCGDPRIAAPGHHGAARQFGAAIKVTVEQAAILQSFPADYPWQGTKTEQYRQIGDAVPPLLAVAILRPLLPGDPPLRARQHPPHGPVHAGQ